jgi:hypothetical protein
MEIQSEGCRDWRARLAKLVRVGRTWQFPLKAFCPRPPSGRPWPKGLPSSAALRDLYALCDGGTSFGGHFGWLRLRELKPAAKNMVEQVRQDRNSGIEQQPFVLGRHLLLAKDSDGFPLVWDAETQLLAWYQPEIDGGRGWEPLNITVDAYLDGLFFPEPGATFVAHPYWLEVLRQIEASA